MRYQHCYRTAGDSGPDTIRPAGKNHRHPCAQDHSSTVSFGEEAELFRENVARLKIGCEQDVRITGDFGVDTFCVAACLLIALSKARGPSRTPPVICPRSAILQSAAASIVAGILEVTVSTAARMATFGLSRPER